ncbi:MAG: hypothetical protein WB646_20225 [Steroidobacteraceae bacterium]
MAAADPFCVNYRDFCDGAGVDSPTLMEVRTLQVTAAGEVSDNLSFRHPARRFTL